MIDYKKRKKDHAALKQYLGGRFITKLGEQRITRHKTKQIRAMVNAILLKKPGYEKIMDNMPVDLKEKYLEGSYHKYTKDLNNKAFKKFIKRQLVKTRKAKS